MAENIPVFSVVYIISTACTSARDYILDAHMCSNYTFRTILLQKTIDPSFAGLNFSMLHFQTNVCHDAPLHHHMLLIRS